jgi:hypothetical protein
VQVSALGHVRLRARSVSSALAPCVVSLSFCGAQGLSGDDSHLLIHACHMTSLAPRVSAADLAVLI